jgi:hypothetical protein
MNMQMKGKVVYDYEKRLKEPEPESITKSLIGRSKMGQNAASGVVN